MKLDYILGESEKDLAPIFSSPMSSITLSSLWIMGILLFLSWPYTSLYRYLQDARIPWTFFSTFAGALIIISYINIRCGLGEIIPNIVYARLEREGVTTREEERDYFSYGLPQTLIHTLTLLLLLLPFLILAGAINGIPWRIFILGLSIIFSASLLCRQVAFLLLLIWGRWRLSGYLGARLFFCFFLFATGFFLPAINPLLLLFNLHFGQRLPLGPVIPSVVPYFTVIPAVILVFSVFLQWVIFRKNRRRGLG
ncbi:MAG: hypothetical protein AB1585_19385 [Thermodesulfobacteriota bacterium]